MKIEGATGKGYGLKINKDNRAGVHAIIEEEVVHAAEDGKAFNLNSGLVSYSANGTMLYIKNNEDDPLVIEALAIGSFEGVTHSDDPYITVIGNPTAGDLISDATEADMQANRNIGSSRTLDADVYKGKSAGTITGGQDIAILQCSPGGRSFFTLNLFVPKGSSLAVKITLNASSGSANWYCAAICHLKDEDVS